MKNYILSKKSRLLACHAFLLTQILAILFGVVVLSSLSFGDPSHNEQETQASKNFIAWQKQLNWNIYSQLDYKWNEGGVSNTIRPLSGQWGVWTGNGDDGLLETKWDPNANTRILTKKIPWTYHCSEVPTVLFGDKAGVSPLYTDLTYRFGVHTGKHILRSADYVNKKHLQISVYDLAVPSEDNRLPIYTESIRIPLNKFSGNDGAKQAFILQWDEEYLKNHGGIISVGSTKLKEQFGLETWVQYTESKMAFGYNDGSGIILSHRSNSTKYGYVVKLLNDVQGTYDALYAMDFSSIPPENVAFVLQSHFMREPRPSGYWGVTEKNNDADEKLLHRFNANINPNEYNINRINTLYKKTSSNTPINYRQLDQFISERQDPLVLAAYVQNEIELIDGVGVPEANRSPEWAKKELTELSPDERKLMEADTETINARQESDILVPGKIKRSPLITFLEGQGSPWEQCELLVYMLRQAGYVAAYVEAEEPFIFSRSDFSRLLRLQLKIPLMNIEDNESDLIRVRYPWVAYYDEHKKEWIHLFPWIKDTKVTEGRDLYGIMPDGYKSGLSWVRHYLESDPKILKHVKDDGNDTAALLFKRFVDEGAKKKGIDPETIGVRYQNIKKSFSGWEDFPKPLCFEGEAKFVATIATRDDLFASVQFKLYSEQNKQKNLTLQPLRLANIYNRVLYIVFEPISENPYETQHNLILRMEGIDGFSPVAGDFNKESLQGVQEKRLLLDGSDREIKLNIIYDQKMEGLYVHPIFRAIDIQETNYTIEKGSLASICINIGRITKAMLDLQDIRYEQMGKNDNNHDRLGRLAYLVGMSYFEKISFADNMLRELYKINNDTGFRVGLSKLSPNLAPNSINSNAKGELIGKPVYVFPQVDMNIFEMNDFANGGIRPDLGEEKNSVMRDYYILRVTDGSSNEHQIINYFYGDKHAVSTVKLLQLAHKRHKDSGQSGTGFLVFTRAAIEEAVKDPDLAAKHYFSHIRGLDLADVLKKAGKQWDIACKGLNWVRDNQGKKSNENNDIYVTSHENEVAVYEHYGYYATVYMTPGDVYSNDGDPNDINKQPAYKGMGTLILAPNLGAGLISRNTEFMHGGYGSRLPENLFDPSNLENLRITRGDDGFKLYNPAQSGDNFRDFLDLRKFNKDNLDLLPKEFWQSQRDQIHRLWGDNFANFGRVDSGYFWNFGTNNQESKPSITDLYEYLTEHNPLALESQIDYKEVYRNIVDPVDIVTGSFQIQAEDLTLKGPFPLVLKRNYSSANPFGSDLGYGWKHNLVPYLVLAPKNEQTGKEEGETIQAAESDGTVILYRKKSENYWEALPKDNPHIVNGGDDNSNNDIFHAYVERKVQGGVEEYYLHGADGALRLYKARSFPLNNFVRKHPYLCKWTTAEGNSINFEYGDSKDFYDYGKIKKIIAANGDFIGLRYDKYGYLIEAHAKDGRKVHYAYDNFGDLESVTLPDGTLTKYTYEHKGSNVKPDACGYLGIFYTCGDNAHRTKVYSTHKIIYEEKPTGRILQNIYDNEGRVVEQKTNRLQGKLTTNARFTYGNATNVNISRREVRDAHGNLTTYKLYGSLIFHIIDPLGNNIYQSWYLAKDTAGKQLYFDGEKGTIQYAPDGFTGLPNQLMKSIDKRGLHITYSYNDKGKLLKKVITGDDLSGDRKLRSLVINYTYTDSSQVASIVNDNGKGTYFAYGDPKYPKLVTRVEQKINSDSIFVRDYTYGTFGVTSGLLVKEIAFNPRKSNEKLAIAYEYNSRGLPFKVIQKKGDGGKDAVTKYEYDVQGNLAREITSGGAYTKYLYDNMNRLIGDIKHNAQGKKLTATYYHYNSNGELEWIKGPANERDYTLFNYDNTGNQVAKVRWRFKIVDPGHLEQKVIPIPGYQSFVSQAMELRQYDDMGRLTHGFDPEGHVTEYKYDALGRITQKTTSEELGGKILADKHYEYEQGGFIAKIIHADKSTTSRFYTTNGLLRQENYSDGTSNKWIYDTEGRIVAETTTKGATWNLVYDDIEHTVTKKEVKTGITEKYIMDIFGNVIERIDGNGNSVHYVYDSLGRLISKEQSKEITKYNYTYDELGNDVVETVLPHGARIQEIIDAAGRDIATLWYEARATKPTERLSYVYHPDGSICKVRGGQEVQECYFVDPDGRHLVDWRYFANPQDPGASLLSGRVYDYDRNGKLLSYNIPTRRSDNYFYDGLGRLTKEVRSWRNATLFTYDLNDRLLRRDTSLGIVWEKEYISPTESSERSTWNGQIIRGKHDKEDNANSHTTTDLNGYHFNYLTDTLGRIESVTITGPSNYEETISYKYDHAGNLIEIKQDGPNGKTAVNRSYDASGNILHESVVYNNTKVCEWEQNWTAGKRNLLTAMMNNNKVATWSFNHSASDLLTKVDFSGQNKRLVWNYVYSEAGLLKERQTPWRKIMLDYDPGGHLHKQHVDSLLTGELVWMLDDKIRAYKFKKAGDIQKAMIYEYNAVKPYGRMEREGYAEELSTGLTTAGLSDYYFDWEKNNSLGLLTKVTTQGLSNFQHIVPQPENGIATRIAEETFEGITPSRLLVAEQLNNEEQQVTLSTTYDAMGRVVERNFKEFGQKQILKWDPQGRLLNVTLKNNHGIILSEWQAFYDGLGRRIQTKFIPYKDGNPENNRILVQTSLYDPEVEFLELGVVIKAGSGQPKTIWKVYGASNNGIYGENNGYHSGLEAVIEHDTGATYGVLNGLNGNIVIATDNNNQVEWQKEIYVSYGPIDIPSVLPIERATNAGDLAKIMVASSLWQGRRIDPTGFINFGARYYDPLGGRFLSCDPLGHAASADLYSYADGDPVNYIDPDGRFASKVYDSIKQTVSAVRETVGDDYKYYSSLGWRDTISVIEDAIKVTPALGIGAVEGVAARFYTGFKIGTPATESVVGRIITGYTRHGINQAISRNSGKGVSPGAILDAIKKPMQTINQADGTIKYIGKGATVVLNKAGKLITTWGKQR